MKEMSLQSNRVHSDDDHLKASSFSFPKKKDERPRRTKRAFSRENFVETLVVVDGKMAKYHGVDAIESYVLTVMTVVSTALNKSSPIFSLHSDRNYDFLTPRI